MTELNPTPQSGGAPATQTKAQVIPPKDPKNMSVDEQRAAGLAPIHSPGTIAPHAKGSPPGDEPTSYRGDVPLKQGQKPVPTDTIPAVEGTTLTQVPDPDALRAMQTPGGQHVPFGRQMNSAGGHPSNVVHDPQVFPRAEVPGTDDTGQRAAPPEPIDS